MIQINKAILHILDLNSGIIVYSQKQLDTTMFDYLTKHIEKSIKDSAIKSGTFKEESTFKYDLNKYLKNEINFIDFSTLIAEGIYSCLSISDNIQPIDVVVCEFLYENVLHIGIIELNNQIAFTHQVKQENNKTSNQIINHYAILPNPTQKIASFAFIDCVSNFVRYHDKKTLINGEDVFILPDKILNCSSEISSKEVIKCVNSIVDQIAESHGAISAVAISKAKNYIFENAETSNKISTVDLGKEAFNNSEIMQNEYASQISKAGIPSDVPIEKSFARRSSKSHKIKTDTGIEISVPSDFFNNPNIIEFVNNPNGTISIQIKNIGKIINK